MRVLAYLLLPAVGFAPLAAAQSSFTLPSWLGVKKATTYDSYLFGYSASSPYQPVHSQLIYDAGDIAMPAAVLKGMALRRSSYIGNTNYAATATVDVVLSVGPNDSATASTTFANNVGPNATVVFSGGINLPQETSNANPPFSIVMPFTTNFTYIAAMGKSLVVDITCTQYTNPGSTGTWYLDAYQADAGSRVTNGATWSQCKFSHNNAYNNSIGHRNPYLGGQWYVSYSNAPPNAPGIATLGFQGVGGSWGPITLPFSLGPLGAPGCGIASDIILAVPVAYSTSGTPQWPIQNIPNNPVLGGASFFDQTLIIDRAANTLGIVSCWPSRWIIGDNIAPPGCMIYKLRDTVPPSTTGSKLNRAVGIEFTY